jgi:hypothetical protein
LAWAQEADVLVPSESLSWAVRAFVPRDSTTPQSNQTFPRMHTTWNPALERLHNDFQ